MSNPQQPELARSRKTPAQDQDAVASVLAGRRDVGADAPRGPVPPENQPGHHPAEEQDKPDLQAFAERLGVVEASDDAQAQGQAAAGRRTALVRACAVVGALGAVVLSIVAGRWLRSRRSR